MFYNVSARKAMKTVKKCVHWVRPTMTNIARGSSTPAANANMQTKNLWWLMEVCGQMNSSEFA